MSNLQVHLNAEDPHYRYDIRTASTMDGLGEVSGAVLARSQRVDDGSYVMVLVSAKHRYALEDAPIEGQLKVDISDPDEAAAFRRAVVEFQKFGRPLEFPDGSLTVALEAPGGLSETIVAAGGRIGSVTHVPEDAELQRVVAVSPPGQILASLTLKVVEWTKGDLGGTEIRLTDLSGYFSASIRIAPSDDGLGAAGEFTISMADVTGEVVAEVLPIFQLLHQVHAPNRLQLRPALGSSVIAGFVVGDEIEAPGSGIVHYFEDLAFLQDFASEPFRVPLEVDRSLAISLREIVRMMLGETVHGTWTEVNVTLHTPREDVTLQPGSEMMLATSETLSVKIGGQVIDLGEFTRILPTAQLALDQPDDVYQARLVPGADNSYTQRVGPLKP
jgi:hypothetical protein